MKTIKLSYANILTYFFCMAVFLSCSSDSPGADETDLKAEKLISAMTLEEKIGQMSQIDPGMIGSEENLRKAVSDGSIGSLLNYWGADKVNKIQRIAVEESRLGIPLIIGRDVIHGYKTIFPIPLGMAATWDPDLLHKAFRISATEAASQGIKWIFAPMIDITWDPRWGRIAEGCGEDPYLASVLAEAMVKGIQGESLTSPSSVAACAKHYAGYGFSEAGRDYGTTYISEPVLRNVVLKPFFAAKEAGVLTFMTAFNDLNGIPATANEFILKHILRNEWGFKGFVVSDWGSVPEMVNHGLCANEKEAAARAINAGVDMEMATSTYSANIKTLLTEKKISEKQIDEAVRNILKVKFMLGLFENPYVNPEAEKIILSSDHLEHARTVARKSIVLLKNEGNILPLSEKIRSVAVIGPLASAPRDQLGTWVFDGDPENSVTPLDAIKATLGSSRVFFTETLRYSRDKNKTDFDQALATAHKTDAVLFFAGEEWILSGEGQSRGEIDLPGVQEELISQLAKTNKPLVVVIMAGRPLAITNVLEEADAVLYAWHGGTMAGPAIADLLFGKESPSGKLPVTFVKGSGQIPFYYYRKNTGRPAIPGSWTPIDSIPAENPQSSLGYRSYHLDYGYTPLLPFGFGLSYTTFAYDNLSLSELSIGTEGSLVVTATVTNTGSMDADEIVQLYVRDRVGSITCPVKELKGFRRIHIKAGHKADISFTLKGEDLAFFNGTKLVTEHGEFDVWVGPDSDHGLHGEFIIR